MLLMTACMNPNGMSFTKLQDVNERKRQYVVALQYYLENTRFHIVFCNNSGEDLSEISPQKYDNRLEMLSFSGNNYDVNLGKGYGEFGIIKYALEHSQVVKKADVIIKVTGRLIVANLSEVYRWHRLVYGRNKGFLCVEGRFSRNFYDSRCFMADKEFYVKNFLEGKNDINDMKGYYFEHFLFDKAVNLPKDYLVSFFVFPLEFVGYSGTTGLPYECEEMSHYERLCCVCDYCQRKKLKFKKQNRRIYYRMELVSNVVRLDKFVIRCFRYFGKSIGKPESVEK